MEQEFEKILDKLAISTRSPRGRFSKANSWILLEKRLPHLQRRILSLHTMAGAAAVAVLCVLGWWAYYMFAPVPLQTVSTLAETRTVTLPDQTEIVLNRYSSLTYPERFRGKDRKVQLQGEAYFEVSKDAAHPFKVEAGYSAGFRYTFQCRSLSQRYASENNFIGRFRFCQPHR